MKNKYEMRVHERNMKIDDLKSQIQHSLLYQQTAVVAGLGMPMSVQKQHQPQSNVLDLSATATSILPPQ